MRSGARARFRGDRQSVRGLEENRSVGFIDCDAHVYESDEAWDHLDPGEREFRPVTVHAEGAKFQQWLVSGQLITRGDRYHPADQTRSDALYPPGATSLSDVPGRLAHMDRLGVDAQVIFSTFFIGSNIPRPLVEAALARSWNRWMAEKYEQSGGRLRWALRAPVRMMDRAYAEMEFGKAHGAVGVHVQGAMAGMVLDDEYFHPFYAKAQDLDLTICAHVGLDIAGYNIPDRRYGFQVVNQLPLGFHRVCVSDLDMRFPRLRWAWLEAGASWVPFVLHEVARAEGGLMTRTEGETTVDLGLMKRKNLFVACQIDDDIPYLLGYAGDQNLVMGTDYGHIDIGSDLYAGEIIAGRADLDPGVRKRIVDDNGRALFGISPAFTPAGDSKVVTV
jgi:predicted TIM-barrel fold metal-dependent hydrolase